MVQERLRFGRTRAAIAGGVIGGAVMLMAAGVQAQSAALPLSFADGAPALLHRVSDHALPAPNSFADLAAKVKPAVIAVVSKMASTSKSMPGRSFGFDQDDPEQQDVPDQAMPGHGKSPGMPGQGKMPKESDLAMLGSGFFISPDGYAVTNSHVVENGDTAEVRTSDDKTYSAKVVGRDSLSDLALIKVEGRNDFAYVKLADRSPRIGEWVLTVGNPFGLMGTITAGIVSARERTIDVGAGEDFLQIDAPINNGDSGGPSFDVDGNVVGVNSMIFSPSGGSVGVAFAIPAETVKVVIPQLKEKGSVTRGWMGAEVQSITPDIADSLGKDNLHGAIVANVKRDGPAAKAGLASGDVITSVSGQEIKNSHELTKKIHAATPGSSVQLGLLRQGKQQSASVTLGQMPDQTTVGVAQPHRLRRPSTP
jgi:serine protease Do